MSYLNPPYKDNFQELCAAMPLFYLDVFEMREILKAQGRLMDDTCDGFELIIDNNFIKTADAATIKLWEAALQITPDPSLTLDQRKSVVAGYICGYGHIGEPEIREIVGQYTENAVTVAFSKGIITLTIDGEIFGETSLLETLLRRIPAHLRLKIVLHVRRSFRQTVYFSQLGVLWSELQADPESMDRLSSVKQVWVSRMALSEPRLYGNQPDFRKASRSVLDVSGAAFDKVTLAGELPDSTRSGALKTPQAGGVYYHTHVKSKLIE